MITLYTWATPNGHKASIMLEKCALPYTVEKVNINAVGVNSEPWFIALNPNGKIPVLVDEEGPDGRSISMFGSGTILVYLAAKTGKFVPENTHDKVEVLQWLMFQMGGIGPMFGEAEHFLNDALQPVPHAINRYTQELM